MSAFVRYNEHIEEKDFDHILMLDIVLRDICYVICYSE